MEQRNPWHKVVAGQPFEMKYSGKSGANKSYPNLVNLYDCIIDGQPMNVSLPRAEAEKVKNYPIGTELTINKVSNREYEISSAEGSWQADVMRAGQKVSQMPVEQPNRPVEGNDERVRSMCLAYAKDVSCAIIRAGRECSLTEELDRADRYVKFVKNEEGLDGDSYEGDS